MKTNIYICTLFITLVYSAHCYSETLPFTPLDIYSSFENLFKEGNRLFSEEKYEEAAFFYIKALELNPECAHTHFNLGQAYFWSKNYQKALTAYKQTIRLQPEHALAYAQIGKLLYDVRQYEDAIAPLKRTLSLNPNNVDARLTLARSYNNMHSYSESLACLLAGLALDPANLNLNFELANVYNTVNRLEEALALYRHLNARAPNNPSIIYNIAFTLKKLERTEESIPFYNRAIELNPHHADAYFSRGLAHLVLGDFEKGWEGYEWRYHRPEYGSLRTYDVAPRWAGESLDNMTILLHAEQGFGDTAQFIRYGLTLKELYPTCYIIAAVQKPLVSLISLCPYIDEVVIVTDSDLPPFDVHVPLMSLPYIMKTSIDTIPCTIPYLYAHEELVQEWGNILSADKNIKIGICWQGNNNYATPNLRMAVALKSMHPKDFAPLSHIPGVTLYSLQKTTGTDQLDELPDDMTLLTFEGDFDNSNGRFMDTAAVIKNLDLVISVDTSICHIAAALGVPTWVILPNPADWRWMQNRTDTPWYPTMRLFKQPIPGDWNSVMAEVAQELQEYITLNKNFSKK